MCVRGDNVNTCTLGDKRDFVCVCKSYIIASTSACTCKYMCRYAYCPLTHVYDMCVCISHVHVTPPPQID